MHNGDVLEIPVDPEYPLQSLTEAATYQHTDLLSAVLQLLIKARTCLKCSEMQHNKIVCYNCPKAAADTGSV